MTSQIRENNAKEMEWGASGLSADFVFNILSDGCRRTALRHLLEQEDAVTVDELVDEVIETTDVVRGDANDVHERLAAQFCHIHLPKLRDAGLIEYRQDRGEIRPTHVLGEFEPYLDWADLCGHS